MRLKDFVDVNEEDWPDDEYITEVKQMKRFMDQELYDLIMGSEYPFLHGIMFSGFQFENPLESSRGLPCFFIDFGDPITDSYLMFSGIIEILIKGKLQIDNSPFMDEIQSAYYSIDGGTSEFIMRLSDGITIYIRSLGISLLRQTKKV